MTNPPLVSFGIPVYNGAATIRQALDTLVAQDYPNIEILIADDGSSDGTVEICQEYADRHSFIRLERNPRNLGNHYNFVNTLRKCGGKYYVWACQDDFWNPVFASKLTALLENDPSLVLAMCEIQNIWDDTDEPFSVTSLHGADLPQSQSYYQNAASLMCKRRREPGKTGTVKNNLYIHGIIRREPLLQAVEAFKGDYPSERQMLSQLALARRMHFMNEILFSKRVHRIRHLDVNPNHPIGVRMNRKFPHFQDWWELGRSITASPVIPVQRKFYFPVLATDYLINVYLSHMIRSRLVWLIDSLPAGIGASLRRLAGRPKA